MKTKKILMGLLVMCAVMCLCTTALAVDDPNDLPELFNGSRQEACCSNVQLQETGDNGTEIAE